MSDETKDPKAKRPTNRAKSSAPASPKPAKVNGAAAERAWEIRRARLRRILRRFALVVGIPTLFAIVYYSFMASDEYVSEVVVNVQAPASSDSGLGDAKFVANAAADLKLVANTLTSHATLTQLIAETDWRDHYSNNGDMFSRLDGSGSEETYEYYRDRVGVTASAGSPLRITVRAFSGEAAATYTEALLAIAERRVNEIALQPIEDQLALAKKHVVEAEKALADLGPAPEPPSGGDAPDQEPGTTSGSAGAAPASSPDQQARAAAAVRLEAARDSVVRLERARDGQKRYFTIISGPTKPDQARYPQRVWGIATVFVVAFALMGVFSMLFGAIREHAKV